MNVIRLALCLGLLLISNSAAHAAFTVFGPTPYRSAADSPFDLSGLGTTFFLENFEDDILSPGLYFERGYPDSTRPILNNSVDEDDGVIDGNDAGGHSVRAMPLFACIGSSCTNDALWSFELMSSGSFPTATGIVITGSNGAAGQIVVEASEFPSGQYELFTFDIEGIISQPLNANDDLFIGFLNPLGIFSVKLQQYRRSHEGVPFFPPTFDHLQYGKFVPEPSSFVLAGMALVCYPGRGICA
jgi:hypothetical protein